MSNRSSEQAFSFRNPIMPGDYPDPSIIRVGTDYYMVTSTFQFFPGVPVKHSTDLVNWQTIGHVVTRKQQMDLTGMPDSFGVFAPDISYHDGKFWVVVPYYHGQPRCTNIVYYADRPEGPYSDGYVLNHHFIDPSIFNDDNGKRYLVFGGGWLHELAADGSHLIGEAKQVWPGTGGAAPEAPHILKRGDWYYLMLAEGGTFFEHMATVARSRDVWGPYEPNPQNPVLKQTDLQQPLQRAGHGKLVQDPQGQWWMTHLGGRPLTPGGYCPLGRETFLAQVTWTEDGWFTVGEAGAPQERVRVPQAKQPVQPLYEAGQIIDRFDGDRLSPEWEWVRHPVDEGYELTEQGLSIHCKPYITLSPQSSLILTRRWRHLEFTAQTQLIFSPKTIGEEAGMVMYRDTDGHLLFTIRRGIGQTAGQMFDVKRLHEQQDFDGLYLQIDRCMNGNRSKFLQLPIEAKEGQPIWLRMELRSEGGGTILFAYSLDGADFISLPKTLNSEFLYPETVQRFHCFTAPRVGVFARGVWGTEHGKAVFREFSYAWDDQK